MHTEENKMSVMPIRKLLINMSVPIMISMFVQALYNVVDSIFVAQINENALTAVSLAFPVQNLMIAIAVGTGMGINSLLSRSLGEKKYEKANDTAKNGIFLAFLSYIVFLIFGLLFTKNYFRSQTDNQQILEYGIAYLRIISIGSIAKFTQIIFERLLQSTGKTFHAMITQGTGAIINIILDPILIFGYFGLPKMGTAGAALATIIGQATAALMAIYFNLTINKEININMKGFKPNLNIIKKIYTVGIPSIVMMSITSVATYGINKILNKFSSTAIAVLGAYLKLQSFVFMPVFGLNNGMVPIIAYNYGAKNKERIIKTIKLSIIYATCIMIIGLLLIQILPDKILGLFNASEDMLNIGIPALRIISLSYIFAGISIVSSSVYQAFGNGLLSLIISASRQLLVLLPATYILSLFGNIDLVWWAYPIAEIASVILSIIFLKYIYDKNVAPMDG
ncbi:MATE family efflux transporter [Clostridium sp. Cult3]|uniref:MATE family efflux transporter n=1 Tax=Clostridium sp. Cult3 TaxID=2079004 RepID=UPI001F2665E7|nr:MATE family efflux transporter [Clostridium sp. Cult3]MCF6459528.1 MATE family efflux transporter [Clostridium sp. Cult3]